MSVVILTSAPKVPSMTSLPSSARIPLVFLPGLLCDAALWRQQAEALTDIADPTVADLTQDDSIAAMAARVLAAAPPRFALAGLSMGGYVAFEILRQQPERVMRLALFDTSASPDSPQRAALRRASIESLKVGRFMGVTKRMLPQLVHPRHVDSPVGDEVRAMAQRIGGEAFVRQQTAILGRPDSRPTLSSIRVPTMVVVGADDVTTPLEQAQIMHEGIAGSVLHVLPECGHLPPLEQPEDAIRLLRHWLLAGEAEHAMAA